MALGLVAFSVRYAFALYQSAFELIVAYAILFLPLAVVGVRSAMSQAPPRLEELGRSLGRRPASVFFRVTLPLIAPGIAAAFALVFISSATELTATLLFARRASTRSRRASGPTRRLLLRSRRALRWPDGAHLRRSRAAAEPARRVDPQRSGVSALEVAGLWKGYGRQSVLRGVDLGVPAGSLTAVLGLSGCGKTTLLRVIAGFERAERGEVSLAGRPLDDGHGYVPPEKRGIGYVPQEGALFPHLDFAGTWASG